jgi:hypothetical protein
VHYSKALTVLKTNTASNPAITTLKLAAGRLEHASIHFPAGCLYKVSVQVFLGNTQVFPTNLGEYYTLEDYTVEAGSYLELGPGENRLTIRGFSTDAVNPHNIYFMFDVRSVDQPELESILYYMAESIGNLSDVIKGWF